MNVASLELCKQLWEVSEWYQPTMFWHHYFEPTPAKYHDGELRLDYRTVNDLKKVQAEVDYYPVYDLGFLLRKLEGYDPSVYYSNQWRKWFAGAHDGIHTQKADTPALLYFK